MTKTSGPQPFNHGRPAPDDFYRALGYALVAFTEIDGSLFALFYALTVGSTPDIDEAKRIFYKSWNFGERLKVVAKAASEKLVDAALCKEWEEIRASVETLKNQRNQLAHSSAAPSFEVVDATGLALVPYLGLPLDSRARSVEKLDTARIVAIAIEFEDMADRIANFLERIAPRSEGGHAPVGASLAALRRRRPRP
jgi:hypothetical protein